MSKLLHPDDARARCSRQFAREHLAWLGQPDGSIWPQTLLLGAPTQSVTVGDVAGVRSWVDSWAAWEASRQPGTVSWETRLWPRLGSHRLPVSLTLVSEAEVAELAGQVARWQRGGARYRVLVAACPWLVGRSVGQRLFDALADYSDVDVERLVSLLCWVDAHPASGLQLRELPVVGMDTKWVEQRRGLIVDLSLARMLPMTAEAVSAPEGRDLHTLLGLAKAQPRIRLRVLCDDLRQRLGGLGDIEAPIRELASLPISPRLALIVENLESGLALPPLESTVAVMKLGFGVSQLRHLPWLRSAKVTVWGDIDTHGFAILDRVRGVLPQAESMLMDRETLLGHRNLWGEEQRQYVGPALERLRAEEQLVYDGLVAGTWGALVRLEQERLSWSTALAAITSL